MPKNKTEKLWTLAEELEAESKNLVALIQAAQRDESAYPMVGSVKDDIYRLLIDTMSTLTAACDLLQKDK